MRASSVVVLPVLPLVLTFSFFACSNSDDGTEPAADGGTEPAADGGHATPTDDGGTQVGSDGGLDSSTSPSTDGGGDAMASGACAAPALLDCSQAANQADARCLPRPSQETAGTVGAGFSPAAVDTTIGLGSGFIDAAGCRLISVLRNFQVAEHGVLLATNLATGARSVVSGTYDDAASGPTTVGTGAMADGGAPPDLDGIEDVQPEPDGKWMAYIAKSSADPQMRLQLVEIDPATGNRRLVWEVQEQTTENNELPCMNGTSAVKLQPNATSLAVGASGEVYLPVNDPTGAGRGLIKLQNGQCSVVSMTGGDGTITAGSGVSNDQGDLLSARFQNGKVYVINDLDTSLLSIDVATGARARLSSSDAQNPLPASQGTMVPLGSHSLAFDGVTILTAGSPSSYFNVASVDPATGTRTGYQVTATAGGGNTGPVSLAQEAAPYVYPFPGATLLLVTLETGVVLYNPDTMASNLLSR